jgi:calcium/calmodulin-dependent 3',5'-cyclic nucleotide phosphodiesterase
MNSVDTHRMTIPYNIIKFSGRRSSRLFGNSEGHVIIEDMRVTNYERVIKILKNIKTILIGFKAEDSVVADLDWVCSKIQTRDLYGFDIASEATKLIDSTDFMSILSNFTNNKEEINKVARENHLRYSEGGKVIRREKSLLKNSTVMQDKDRLSSIIQLNNNISDSPLVSIRRFSDGDKEQMTIYNLTEEKLEFDIASNKFNIFELAKKIERRNMLPRIYYEAINNVGFADSLNMEKLHNFSARIQAGYNQNVLYHNDLHAADLCQILFSWVSIAGVQKTLGLSNLDVFSLYTSAIVHDFKHPGYTNAFHINNITDLALLYNDKSVLENMHISEAFKVLVRPDCNFIENFSITEFKEFRKRVIECILATDMSHHSMVISRMKTKAQSLEIIKGVGVEKLINHDSKTFFEDTQELLNLLIHLGDLSHNSKEFEISKIWTDLLYEEFFRQGDHEISLNAPISMFCNRKTTNIPNSQVSFIKGIIIPSFDVLVNFFPILSYTLDNLEENLEKWEQQTI